MPTPSPPGPVLDRARDLSAEVASLYPRDTPAAQRLLADAAVRLLAAAGHRARSGTCGEHATADVVLRGGVLVLVPMADLDGLDAALADEDDRDPALWHVLARNHHGRLLLDPDPAWGCPAVLRAVRAGIEPEDALRLAGECLADEGLLAVLALGGVRP